MVEKIFIVLDGSSADKHIIYPHLFISAGICYRNDRFWVPKINKTHELFVDSGAFSVLSKFGEYPYTPRRYILFVKKMKADYAAIMDYPCEPNGVIKLLIKERIHRTIDNAIKLMDLEPDINWVMVIQGWEVDDYLYCLDLAKEHGLLTPLTAIGSVCVRKNLQRVREIVVTLRDNILSKIKLHCFGLDLRFAKDLAIFNAVYSFDTHAWCLCSGFPKTPEDKIRNFKQYLEKLKTLTEVGKQKTLTEFASVF